MPLITDNSKKIDNLITRTQQGQEIVRWILDNRFVTRQEICAHILQINDEYTRLAQQLINEAKKAEEEARKSL